MTTSSAAPPAAGTPAPRVAAPTGRFVPVVGAAILAVALVTTAIGLVLAGGAYQPEPAGLPDPGPLVGWGLPAVRLLTDAAALLTVGWLVAAAFLVPAGRDGVVSRVGRADLVRATWAGVVWAVLALTQAMFVLADALGLPLSGVLSPGVVGTYGWSLATTRALLIEAVLALVVALAAALTASIGLAASWAVLAVAAASLPALGGHAASLGDHALAITGGVAHVSAAMLWVGGLAALAVHAARRDPGLRRGVARFSILALICITLLAASGLASAYSRLDEPSQLLTTGYGQVVLVKLVAIAVLAGFGALMRYRLLPALDGPRARRAFTRLAALEVAVMAVAIALGVSLSLSPSPRIEGSLPTQGETLLGFPYPPPPDAANLILGFRLDPLFLVGSLVAAALYCAGVARLLARGDRWPWGRTLSWLAGIGVVIWCTNAGIASYAQVSVGLHMVQHMTLTMLAPILLVLGAPITLALRALRPSPDNERGPREWLLWLLHSPITVVLTNPFYVFFVYVIGLYGLYLTPLFGWLMGSHIGHYAMLLHFLASGYLFYWVIIGIDPRPRPLPYWARFLMLLMAVGVHGFFSVALMMMETPLAQVWYGIVRPEWVSDPVADTVFGGQVAWGITEVPTLVVLIALGVQWARDDDREARRKDRQADRDGGAELAAYNEHLAALAARDRRLEERGRS